MLVAPADSWKLVLAVALFGTVLASAWARPPRRAVPGPELGRLVLGAIALYGAGLLASLTRHPVFAVVLYAFGVAISALAAWLSRAVDTRGDTPPGEAPSPEEPPPPSPDGAPRFDWPAFERELAEYERRTPKPVESR